MALTNQRGVHEQMAKELLALAEGKSGTTMNSTQLPDAARAMQRAMTHAEEAVEVARNILLQIRDGATPPASELAEAIDLLGANAGILRRQRQTIERLRSETRLSV